MITLTATRLFQVAILYSSSLSFSRSLRRAGWPPEDAGSQSFIHQVLVSHLDQYTKMGTPEEIEIALKSQSFIHQVLVSHKEADKMMNCYINPSQSFIHQVLVSHGYVDVFYRVWVSPSQSFIHQVLVSHCIPFLTNSINGL